MTTPKTKTLYNKPKSSHRFGFIVICCFIFILLMKNSLAQSYSSYCTAGIKQENAGNLDGAIVQYTSAINLKPDNWGAYSYRAKVYYRKGKYDQALSDISKAIELSPTKIFLYHVRANCYLAKKSYEKAIADYNMVLLNPKKSDKQLYQVYLYRGESYYYNGQYSEAVADFTKAIQLALKQNEKLTNAYNLRAYSYYYLQKYSDAITEFENILSSNSKNTYALFYQGLCYKKLGKNEKAKTNAQSLIDLDPSKGVYFSGDKILDLYDLEARKTQVNQSLQIAKKDISDYKASTSKTVQTVKLAEAFAQLDKAWFYSSCIEKSDCDLHDTILDRICYVYSIMAEKPELPELARKYLVQANAAVEDKNYSSALTLFGKAISIAPYYPLSYYNRSLVYELQSNYSDAIDDMKKYIELDPTADNARAAQDKIYEWEGKTKTTTTYKFVSADGKNIVKSNSEATMNQMAIDLENVIGNKIKTDNKATEGFFMGIGMSTPRDYWGQVPKVPPVSSLDTTLWKDAIYEDGKLGAGSGWYAEIGGGLSMAQSAKVKFYYNPMVASFSKNKIDWSSRKDSPLFSGTDRSKSFIKFELGQRYGISYAPATQLVFAFYYRIGMTLPVSKYYINYVSKIDSESFLLEGESKAAFIPFSHSLGFSVSYSFLTLSYESYFLREKYRFTATYHGPSPLDVEKVTTFDGKVPMRTSRIGISIHF